MNGAKDRCGSGTCWHAQNGRQCPPEPWPVVEGDLVEFPAPNLPGGFQLKCVQCGCSVTTKHQPGSEDCQEARLERDTSRGQ